MKHHHRRAGDYNDELVYVTGQEDPDLVKEDARLRRGYNYRKTLSESVMDSLDKDIASSTGAERMKLINKRREMRHKKTLEKNKVYKDCCNNPELVQHLSKGKLSAFVGLRSYEFLGKATRQHYYNDRGMSDVYDDLYYPFTGKGYNSYRNGHLKHYRLSLKNKGPVPLFYEQGPIYTVYVTLILALTLISVMYLVLNAPVNMGSQATDQPLFFTTLLKKQETSGKLLINRVIYDKYREELVRISGEYMRYSRHLLQDISLDRESTRQTYIVKAGDTLEKVSMKLYGDKRFVVKIYELNADRLKSINTIQVGDVLTLPFQ